MLTTALLFAPLLLVPTPQEAAPAAEVAWTDFDFFAERYIYLDVVIEGVETQAVLDCGAGVTVVSTEFAEEIGLPQGQRIQARGVGGMQSARLVSGVDIDAAGLELRGIPVAVIDLQTVGERIGRPTPIILGREVFARRVVDIDYPRARLRLHEPEGYEYGGPGNTVELIPIGTHWAVDGKIEGRPARFVLDTGSGGTGTVFGRYEQKHGLLENREPRSDLRAGGVGGAMSLAMASLDSLEFGGFEFEDVPIGFDGGGDDGAFSVLPGDCNLGNKIFGRFRLVFDATRRELHVEPGPDWDRPLPRERTGLQLTYRGDALEVLHVAGGSPAKKAGFTPGEEVVAIDGRQVGKDYWQGQFRWCQASPGTEVKLRMASGDTRTLILATYY